uniref:Uncharacterized protein n=1 Tax=Anguilla anguilla TaxID=7936 RepID=A0A0E9P736_ANGAN
MLSHWGSTQRLSFSTRTINSDHNALYRTCSSARQSCLSNAAKVNYSITKHKKTIIKKGYG